MAEFEFEVMEVAKTTFKPEKKAVFVAKLQTEDKKSIAIKEENQSSFEVGEVWKLEKEE